MLEVARLRRLFGLQLLVRGLGGAALAFALIAFAELLTSPEESALMAVIPGLSELRSLVQAVQPWELFVVVFLLGALLDAVKRVQAAALDRYNLRRLVELGRTELAEGDDPRAALRIARARLTGRRRMLEELLLFDPAVITLAAVGLVLGLIGLPIPALLCASWALVVVALLPWLIARMSTRRSQAAARAPRPREWTRAERRADPAAFADERLDVAARSSLDIINRPVDRLVVAWPIILLGAIVVAATSIAAILQLAPQPGRALLLIVVIVVSARAAGRLVSSAEQLAFFASVVTLPLGEATGPDDTDPADDSAPPHDTAPPDGPGPRLS